MMRFSFIFRGIKSIKSNARLFSDWIVGECETSTPTSIKDKLKSLSVDFTDGYTCFHVKNCKCGRNKSNSLSAVDVYVNKNTGFFLCEKCKETGDWDAYTAMIQTASEENGNSIDFSKYLKKYNETVPEWNEVAEQSQALSYLTDDSIESFFCDFKLPLCPRNTIENLQLRVNNEKDTLYFPIINEETIVGVKSYHKNKEEMTKPSMDCPGFLSSNNSHVKKNQAVIVGNIPDFMSLLSINISYYDIICLPHGITHLSQSSLPFFENYEKIILWLGEGALEATGHISKKLIERRCYFVVPTDSQKSASLAVAKKGNIKKILMNAKPSHHDSVTTFSSFRDAVLAELQNINEVMGVPWQKFPALTNILKGHRRGELTILTGPTGAGKTTFLSEYSLDLASQGVNTLWGSFEIKNTRLAKIMLTQFNGASLSSDPKQYNALCDRFEKLPLFFLTFHGQESLQKVMDAVYHCSYTHDIAHVVIDNVQFMIDVSPDSTSMDRFWKQDLMIQMFRSFASKNNCHVTLVMHPKKTEGFDLGISSVFGGGKATQEADNVLILQRKHEMSFGTNKFLQIAKNRYSGDLGHIPLFFNKSCLSFASAEPQLTGDDSPNELEHLDMSKYSNFNEDDDFAAEYRTNKPIKNYYSKYQERST